MSDASTKIEARGVSFDLAGVGDYLWDNLWLFLIVAFVLLIFFIFQKGGFAEKLLEYRTKKHELDVKQLEKLSSIADKLSRKYDGDEPFLPLLPPDDHEE